MRSAGWLLVGAGLLGLTHARWGIGAIAFLAPVPLLGWLRNHPGLRARAWLGLALVAGYTLAFLKITTAPIPTWFGLAFGLPVGVIMLPAYLAWDLARRQSPAWAPLVFAAATVVMEFAQHRFTELGSWGAVAYTQLENLPLLQVSSLVGMAGVSFLVSGVAASIEAVVADPARGAVQLGTASLATVAALAFGTVRLGLAQLGETVTVAAVGTTSHVAGFPYPSVDEMEVVNQGLLERTAAAAKHGAKVVGWTEASTLVLPENDAAFEQRLADAAARLGIDLVAAYVVPDDATASYQNKLVWARPDGTVDHVYHKHHPVPGEPAVPGTELFRAVETGAGRATAAICYDYDFPTLARAQGRLGLDLAVIPSSDWRGIDPLHAQMASLRAIENGFSLLRPTRSGLTAAFDPYGRARAWQSSFDEETQVVLAAVPRHGVATLYTRIGDVFVGLCAAFTVATLALPTLRRLAGRG